MKDETRNDTAPVREQVDRPEQAAPGTGDIVRALDQTQTSREEEMARHPVGVENPGETRPETLLAGAEADRLRNRWKDIQTGFVDEPRRSVEQADALVADVIKQVAQVFANERSGLEEHWSKGGEVSTEDLRVALRRYRSFFDRLLSL